MSLQADKKFFTFIPWEYNHPINIQAQEWEEKKKKKYTVLDILQLQKHLC